MNMPEETNETHPSYGMVEVSTVHGSQNLFGSHLDDVVDSFVESVVRATGLKALRETGGKFLTGSSDK